MAVLLVAAVIVIVVNNKSVSPEKNNISETETNHTIVEIPVDKVKGITKKQAEELCYSVMGKKDADTGFAFSFGVSGAVEKDNKQYYVIRASWLVNNNHMSYIGDFFVSSDGKEVRKGLALQGEYEIGELIFEDK